LYLFYNFIIFILNEQIDSLIYKRKCNNFDSKIYLENKDAKKIFFFFFLHFYKDFKVAEDYGVTDFPVLVYFEKQTPNVFEGL